MITWSMTIWLRSQCLCLLGQSIRTVYVVYFYSYVNQNIHICNKFFKLCGKKHSLINVYVAYMHCFLKFLSLWSCWYTDCISTLTRHDINYVALLYWLCIQTVNWSYFNRRFLSSENKKRVRVHSLISLFSIPYLQMQHNFSEPSLCNIFHWQ